MAWGLNVHSLEAKSHCGQWCPDDLAFPSTVAWYAKSPAMKSNMLGIMRYISNVTACHFSTLGSKSFQWTCPVLWYDTKIACLLFQHWTRCVLHPLANKYNLRFQYHLWCQPTYWFVVVLQLHLFGWKEYHTVVLLILFGNPNDLTSCCKLCDSQQLLCLSIEMGKTSLAFLDSPIMRFVISPCDKVNAYGWVCRW